MFNEFRDVDENNLTISQKQLNNAKLYKNRWDWVKSLPSNLDIIEVGVASGDYSAHIINLIKPNSLHLVDVYDQCDPMLARPGQPKRYEAGENLEFIKNRFKNNPEVTIIQETSQIYLPKLVKKNELKFDMIYLDASHHFEDVCSDIESSVPLLRQDGILAFNDYMFSDENGEKYGVVQAANKFLHANQDWEVVGFALDERMYADLYIRRI